MTTRTIAALALLSLPVFITSTPAQEPSPVRSIAVSGTVETMTAPDRVVWNIALRDTDKDIRAALKKNDVKIEAVASLRERLGIGQGDLKTGRLNIRREYERDKHGHQGEFKHFVVTRSVTIRQRDLSRFDEYLETLISSAEMEVSFNFESSNIHQVRADTRLKALQAAKDKAAAFAEVVGEKLGSVLTIREHPSDGSSRNFHPLSNSMFVQSQPPADISTDRFIPGAISVQVTVYATFELH